MNISYTQLWLFLSHGIRTTSYDTVLSPKMHLTYLYKTC